MTDYRVTSVSLTMTLADSTTLNIGNNDIILGSLSVSEASSSSTEFSIGTAISKRLSFQLKNFNDEYSTYDFNDAQIVATIIADADRTVDEANGIVSGFAGTIGSDSVVTLPGASMDANGIVTMSGTTTTDNYTLGVFYVVEKPNYNGGTITFNALDGLYKTDRDYTTALTFPATLLQIYNELCTNCGLVPVQATIPNANYSVPVKPNLDAMTAADMLCYIAQVSGTFAQMDSQGRLELKRYGVTSHALSETFSMEVDTDDVVITGVKVTECFDETDTLKRQTVLNGTAAYALTIAENPLIGSGKAQAVADFLTSVYVGMQFRPLRITVPTNPEVHVGDGIVFTDYKGNTYSTYATEVEFSTNAPTTVAMNAASPERNSAVRYSAEAKALAESKRLVENEKTARELAIEAIQQQIAGAGGMYETTVPQPGGGSIYYLHNKPTLSESTTILRIDDTGIYISNDGGQTYPLGLDYSGTEILNKIYAIGIDADYITTGLIQSRVSGFSLNMDTGEADLSQVTIHASARTMQTYPIEVWNTTDNIATKTSADNYSRILPGSYRTITNTYALSGSTRSSYPTSVYDGYFGGYYIRLTWSEGDGTAQPATTEQAEIFPHRISLNYGSTLGIAARLENSSGLGMLILHNSGSDYITLKGDGTIGRGAMYNPTKTATLLDASGNTSFPGQVHATSGSIIAGTNGDTTAERQVKAQAGAGTIYLYSNAATTGNRGLYGVNPSGTAFSIIRVTSANVASFYGNADTATTATTATVLSPTGAASFTSNNNGNFVHKRTTATDTWNICKNDASWTFQVVWETGVVNVVEGGDYRVKNTSIVPIKGGSSTSGYIRFPNLKIQIAWRWVSWTGAIATAWGGMYETASVISLGNWSTAFSEEPKVFYGVRSDSGQAGVMVESYGAPTASAGGTVYLTRGASMTSQKYWVCALGIGAYT